MTGEGGTGGRRNGGIQRLAGVAAHFAAGLVLGTAAAVPGLGLLDK